MFGVEWGGGTRGAEVARYESMMQVVGEVGEAEWGREVKGAEEDIGEG